MFTTSLVEKTAKEKSTFKQITSHITKNVMMIMEMGFCFHRECKIDDGQNSSNGVFESEEKRCGWWVYDMHIIDPCSMFSISRQTTKCCECLNTGQVKFNNAAVR